TFTNTSGRVYYMGAYVNKLIPAATFFELECNTGDCIQTGDVVVNTGGMLYVNASTFDTGGNALTLNGTACLQSSNNAASIVQVTGGSIVDIGDEILNRRDVIVYDGTVTINGDMDTNQNTTTLDIQGGSVT